MKTADYYSGIRRVLRNGLTMSAAILLLSGSVYAEEPDLIIGAPEEAVYSSEYAEDNDDLFAGYVENAFMGPEISTSQSYSGMLKKAARGLSGLNGQIYTILRQQIADVAAGSQPSTVFSISVEDLGLSGMTWTAEELGVDAIVVDGKISSLAVEAANEALGISTGTIMNRLLADCPYDLYWYDKTEGMGFLPGYSARSYGGDWELYTAGSFQFSFTVANEYAQKEYVEDGYYLEEYEVDTSVGETVQHAASVARKMVEDNASLSDRDKLDAYREGICDLTAYNHAAADNHDTPYGNPWQLIWVFDEDNNTSVVCEGYAKAFQYLCDMSTFQSRRTASRLVTGTMSGGTGAGGHMWNIVTMDDGKNYLVDVTNCDEGTIGSPDLLFLVGTDLMDAESGYQSGYQFHPDGGSLAYVYDEDTLSLFEASELELAGGLYPYGDSGQEHVEYDFDFGDRDLLPGWDQEIREAYSGRVWYDDSSDEEWFTVTVTDVQTDQPACVRIEHRTDENDPDNQWWYLRAEAHGSAVITVTFSTSDGHTDTETFTWNVGDEVYEVRLRPDSGSYNVLPGGTVAMTAEASHEGIDPDTGEYYNRSREEMAAEGVVYVWTVDENSLPEEIQGQVIVTPDAQDPAKATVTFPSSDAWDEAFGFDARIVVTIFRENEQKAEDSCRLNMRTQYLEIWPAAVDGDMEVGTTLVIEPELRAYSADYANGYELIDDGGTHFFMETDDANCAEVTEQADGSFLVLRKGDWDTNIRLIAERENDQGDFEEVCRQDYHLNGRDYHFWYEIDGEDAIFSDGSRTFGFNLENLNRLESLDETVEWSIQAGTGEWDESAGSFGQMIAEGDGWSFNTETKEITFDGAALYAAGIDRVETRVTASCNGYALHTECRGFDVREAWYDFEGTELSEETLFLNDTRQISKNDTGNIHMADSVFPEGEPQFFRVLSLTAEAEEDPLDTRDPILLEEEEDFWRLVPVRGGEVTFTAELEIFDPETDRSEIIERSFRKWVGDFRAFLNLRPENGSYDFRRGTSLRLIPRFFIERYDWQTGRQWWEDDPSGYRVDYEAEVDWIDGRFVEDAYDGDYGAAWADADRYWSYVVNEDGSITVTTEDDAPAMNIRVAARLMEPSDEGTDEDYHEVSYTEERLFCAPNLYGIEQNTTLDPGMPVGASGTYDPQLMWHASGADPVSVTEVDDTAVTWRFDWYAGSGEDTDDIPHIVITDAAGKRLSQDDPFGTAPFTIRRTANWGMGFTIYACAGNGGTELASASYWFDGQDYRAELVAESGHTNGYPDYVGVYDGEEIAVRADTSSLDAIPAVWQSLIRKELVCRCYDYRGNEVQLPAGYAFTAEELDSETGFYLTAARTRELLNALYMEHPDSKGFYLGLEMVVSCQDNTRDTDLCRAYLEVDLMEEGIDLIRTWDRYSWDDDSSIVAGDSLEYPGREALYFLTDADHTDRNSIDDRMGSYWIVSITDITSSDPSVLLPEEDEAGWHIRALNVGSADITLTFTGGPAGRDVPMTHTMPLHVTDIAYELEVLVDGSSETSFDYLVGTEVPFECRLVRKASDSAGTISRTAVDQSEYELHMNCDNRYLQIDTDDTENQILRACREGDQTLGITAVIDGQTLRKSISFHIGVAQGEIAVNDSLVIDLLPGQTYTISDLMTLVPDTITVTSLRHPEGVQSNVTDAWFAWAPEGFTLPGYQDDKANKTLTVAEDILSFADSNGIYRAVLDAGFEDSMGVRAYATIQVCVRKAHELPQPLENYNVLYIPAGTETIEEEAFAGTGAEVVVIPPGCTEIRSGAFADCPNLEYVLVDSLDSIRIWEDAFTGSDVTVLEQ